MELVAWGAVFVLLGWQMLDVVRLREHEQEHCAQIGELQDLQEYLIRVHGVDRDLFRRAVDSGVLRDEVAW